jgi:hypothetical protein
LAKHCDEIYRKEIAIVINEGDHIKKQRNPGRNEAYFLISQTVLQMSLNLYPSNVVYNPGINRNLADNLACWSCTEMVRG